MEGHSTGRAGTGCVLSPRHFLPQLQLDSKAPPEGGADRTRKPGLCTRFSEILTSPLSAPAEGSGQGPGSGVAWQGPRHQGLCRVFQETSWADTGEGRVAELWGQMDVSINRTSLSLAPSP